MHIAIDIDDTLTDTFSYLLPYLSEYFGWDKDEIMRTAKNWQMLPKEWWDDEEAFARAYYDRVIPDAPMKKDAVHYVNKLHEDGHKITILTARTTRFYTDPYKTCKDALDKHGIQYDEIVCAGDKGAACKELGVDVLVDDWWFNCDAAQKAGVKTLMFGGNGYPEDKNFERVYTWEEAYKRLTELAEEA